MTSHDDDRPDVATPDQAKVGEPIDAAAAQSAEEKWPFGFILTIVMVSIYLAYRLIQGVVLLIEWLF